MKVNEFIEMYNKNSRIDIAKHLQVEKYVGIEYKRQMAELILDNCTTVVDGEVHIDSIERYLLFTIAVISMHTNLEFSNGEVDELSSIDDYDALCESGLLAKVIDTFQEDYMSCQEILNMMTADRLQNNMTIEKKLYKFLDEIQGIISNAVDVLTDNLDIDSLGDLPLDQEKLVQLYNLIENRK